MKDLKFIFSDSKIFIIKNESPKEKAITSASTRKSVNPHAKELE